MQQVSIHANLANLKSDVYKLDTDKLEKVLSSVNNLKSKVDKLYVDKVTPAPSDLSKISDLLKIEVVTKDVSDELDKKVNAIDTSRLIKKTDYNAKIKETEDKILSVNN